MKRWADLAVVVVLAGCSAACNWDDPAPPGVEQRKFAAVMADPLLSLDVPGGVPEPITGNPGHGGQMPTPTQAFRWWRVADMGDATFIETVKLAVAAGLRVDRIHCGPTRIATGLKLVDGYVTMVTIGLGPAAHDELQVSLTQGGGSDGMPGPLPPPSRPSATDCPEPIKALVSLG